MNGKYFKNKLINFLDYRVAQPLARGLVAQGHDLLKNIGIKRNGSQAPRALIIYVSAAVPYYIAGDVLAYPHIQTHAMYWEAAEMVRVLVESGYVVDFIDCFKPTPAIDWEKYSLVIDERNNLIQAPKTKGQVTAYYCTGLPWSFHNASELKRIEAFHQRNHIWLDQRRFIYPNFSDKVADYFFYFANPEWNELFSGNAQPQEITTTVTFVPESIPEMKNRREFMWIGSNGAIHKGLDLAVEAFRDLPGIRFHIFGSIEDDSLFFKWLKREMELNTNIIFHGTAQFSDPAFLEIAHRCVGHIFPSCSEGGPGSVAQTSYFGMVPIVTRTANARSAALGHCINSDDPTIIIQEIRTHVKHLLDLSEQELKHKREQLIDFSRRFHSREAYANYFKAFVKRIQEE